MTKCNRCDLEMLRDLDIRISIDSSLLRATRPKTSGILLRNDFGDGEVAVFLYAGI